MGAPNVTIDNLESLEPIDSNPTVRKSLAEALAFFHTDRLGSLMINLEKEQGNLESLKSDMEFFLNVSAQVRKLQDDKGGLNVDKGHELESLLNQARQMGASIPADLCNLNTLQAQNITSNLQSAIELKQLHINFGVNRAQSLHQQFNQCYLILNTIYKKLGQMGDRLAGACKS